MEDTEVDIMIILRWILEWEGVAQVGTTGRFL
jgi:hypothetical protein